MYLRCLAPAWVYAIICLSGAESRRPFRDTVPFCSADGRVTLSPQARRIADLRYSRCEDVLHRLLERRADVHRTDKTGRTALHLAAFNGLCKARLALYASNVPTQPSVRSPQAIAVLNDHGADPNAQDVVRSIILVTALQRS